MHNVDGIIATQRLAENIGNASSFKHCTSSATSNHTGTFRGRTHHNNTSGILSLNRVRNSGADNRDTEEVLASFLDALGDSGWNFLGLAVSYADHTFAITNNDKSGEAEATTTFDNLGDTVNGDNALDVVVLFLLVTSVTTLITTTATLLAVIGGILSAFTTLMFCH